MKNKDRYESMEELYTDNRKLVFTYIYSIDDKKNIGQVEDLASTIWLKVWECGDFFLNMDRKGVKYYLRAMVKTTVSDYYRQLNKDNTIVERVTELVDPYISWDSIEEKLFHDNKYYYLSESIHILSDEEKLLITMRFLHNLSAKEIGSLLGINEGTVRVRQLRILRKLRNKMKELIDEGGDFNE